VTAAEGRFDVTKGRLDATDALVREHIESIAGRLTAVDGRLAAVDDHLAALRRRAADHDSALEDISRSIAAEVERHTSDALVDSQHSLQLAVNSIAQLALAMAESARDITEDVSAESATALLDSFRIDLDAILAQLGFESLDTSIGDVFDPHRHRALKRVPTSDAAQDKAITRVIRDGYSSAATGRILLFADVEVSRYRP
jgi:molecular chaperone GrpE (heat shock protein)